MLITPSSKEKRDKRINRNRHGALMLSNGPLKECYLTKEKKSKQINKFTTNKRLEFRNG